MRSSLLRLLGEGAEMRSSYLPGRSGFLIRSPRSLADLRRDLRARGWACRLCPIHPEGGRHFLEPSESWLAARLTEDTLDWWGEAHRGASPLFLTPARRERIRRLPWGGAEGSWTRGFVPLRGLALRLEALSVSRLPDKQWRGIAAAFDEWWKVTRLYAAPASPLSRAVVEHLRRCAAAPC